MLSASPTYNLPSIVNSNPLVTQPSKPPQLGLSLCSRPPLSSLYNLDEIKFRRKTEPLLSRVPHQQTKTYIALVPLQMLHLTTNSIFSQPVPKHQALGFLTPNKVDSVAPANKIFSIFLFLVLYYLSYKCFLTLCPILQFSERRLKVSII